MRDEPEGSVRGGAGISGVLGREDELEAARRFVEGREEL
jgi:hypothetical protein